MHFLQFPKRPQHQTATNQQHQSHRQLTHHQRSAEHLRPARSRSAPRGIFQRRGNPANQQGHQRRQPKNRSSNQTSSQRKNQHPPIHHNLIRPRNPTRIRQLHQPHSAIRQS